MNFIKGIRDDVTVGCYSLKCYHRNWKAIYFWILAAIFV